jgi:hypothetical protein
MRSRGPQVRIGWFHSLTGIVFGAFVGVALTVAAVALLYWAEGRTNLADLARQAHVAPPEQVDPALEGALVSASGVVATDETVADPEFLREQPALELARAVEMYAWVEHERRSSGRREWSYTREWTARPADSGRFHDPGGHHNPAMRVGNGRWAVASGRVAVYGFRPREAVLPRGVALTLSDEMLRADPPYGARLDQGFLYIGEHSVAAPSVGDLRMRYEVLRPGALATLFGDQHGAQVAPHALPHGSFYRLLPGGRDNAIATLAVEHRVVTWLLRLLGLFLLYMGLNLAAAPVSAMFDVVPLLGRASRALVAAVTLPAALGLAVATITLSRLVHGPRSALVVVLVIVVFAVLFARRRRRQGRSP